MSFRLRLFLLVLIVAGTAIGATAWLTMSLTSREVTRVDHARDRHQAEIVTAVRKFGVLNGQWNGVDGVVGDLAASTGLHIRVETRDGVVLTDSDHIDKRAAGPVQMLPAEVDPMPQLEPGIIEAARKLSTLGQSKAPSILFNELSERPPVRPRPDLPEDLFGVVPSPYDLDLRGLFQVAQYRAALSAVRCMAAHGAGPPELATAFPPYIDRERREAQPECVRGGVAEVLKDTFWLDMAWTQLAECDAAAEAYSQCLTIGFSQAAASTSAVPVQIFFGAREGGDLANLQRPAMLGAAALLLAAAVGTALIARRVSRPVRLLTGASLQLAAGRLDVRVPTHGQDELARLSGAFNAMAEALQRSEERQRRLVADVAHELRTPLSNLRGYLEGLADGVVEPSPELFASLHEETLLQRRILDDLQVLALAEAGELGYDPIALDLSELTEAAATAHRVVATNAGIDVVVDAPAPVEVCADPDRMRQVLGNLMSNAIRYTDAGGRVELKVGREGPDAILTVHDTGVGMNSEEVARVFDRFWRADPARQRATGGSGLGLTIVRRIVADLGGDVSATSEPGLGTTFTVRLPAVTDIRSILNR
ncbi:ATP-binding protein [Actinoplanes sp. NEAU-A12]|uniref:histidine kinase n=1 Tax=Actinoplanes sandaracinus TaxID=3045177 RepID=A0ABT6WJQ0_9ACTN|nr:ATP-binding protein [Actinoplanes sandaracinus]MDI6099957.1 ATP-binding protein [Actinoplanes sandaracinus]